MLASSYIPHFLRHRRSVLGLPRKNKCPRIGRERCEEREQKAYRCGDLRGLKDRAPPSTRCAWLDALRLMVGRYRIIHGPCWCVRVLAPVPTGLKYSEGRQGEGFTLQLLAAGFHHEGGFHIACSRLTIPLALRPQLDRNVLRGPIKTPCMSQSKALA